MDIVVTYEKQFRLLSFKFFTIFNLLLKLTWFCREAENIMKSVYSTILNIMF